MNTVLPVEDLRGAAPDGGLGPLQRTAVIRRPWMGTAVGGSSSVSGSISHS